MQSEDAPPGFWKWPGNRPVLVDGVEFASGVPTRFFQTVDPHPSEWGRLYWRIQLNRIAEGRAVSPVFRTFYPGVEWNLNRPDYRWFLTAWFRWEGPGPAYRDPRLPGPVQVEEATALFRIAWMPKPKPPDLGDRPPEPDFDRPLFLRSRIDARDRHRISEALQPRHAPPTKSDSGVISLDDIVEGSD